MPLRTDLVAGGLAMLVLAGCGTASGKQDRPAPAAAGATVAGTTSDFPMTLGEPYTIGARTFVPADTLNFDEVGRALIRQGEGAKMGFHPEGAITAAHRTLPLPSYVEVTSLASGRTILVRVVERGPMDADHVVALSPGAAAQLGFTADDEPVRVRRVNPPEQERAALRFGGRAAERLETPPGLRAALMAKLTREEGASVAAVPAPQPAKAVAPVSTSAPTPAAASTSASAGTLPSAPRPMADEVVAQAGADFSHPAPVTRSEPRPIVQPIPQTPPAEPAAKTGRYAVQVAALSSRANADALARKVGGHVEPAGALFRIRTGPYATQAQAKAAAAALHGKGFPQARMVANDGR